MPLDLSMSRDPMRCHSLWVLPKLFLWLPRMADVGELKSKLMLQIEEQKKQNQCHQICAMIWQEKKFKVAHAKDKMTMGVVMPKLRNFIALIFTWRLTIGLWLTGVDNTVVTVVRVKNPIIAGYCVRWANGKLDQKLSIRNDGGSTQNIFDRAGAERTNN